MSPYKWWQGERIIPHRDEPVTDDESAAERLCSMADRYEASGCPLGADLLACLDAIIRKKIRVRA